MAERPEQGMMAMDQRAKLLYDHWRSVCGENGAPYRQDINPARFRDILDSVFILDWNSTTDVRFRLAGSLMCDSFGMELRGMNFFALWQGEARARLKQLLHRVVTEPCVGHAVGIQKNERGENIDFEILLLPLNHSKSSLKQILGCKLLTREESGRRQSLPVATQWIDGITVYKVPEIKCDHSYPQSTMPMQSSSRGRFEKGIVKNGRSAHPFQVIEGGLAREK